MKNKPNIAYQVFIAILLVLISAMLFKNCIRKNDTKKDQINFINSLSDTVHQLKYQDSLHRARISVLQTSKAKLFSSYVIADSQIMALQALASQYKTKLEAGSSITTATTTTVYRDTGKTEVIYINNDYDSARDIYPNYRYHKSSEWIDYTMLMNKDTSVLQLKVIDKYAVVLGYEKKKPFVDVINFNPYSSTKILRSYQVLVPKEKRWGIGFSSGVGINSKFRLQPFIGIGVNYNVFKF